MRVAIGIDRYKRKTFEKGLGEAGFEFEINPGFTSDSLLISVVAAAERLAELSRLIKSLNDSARRRRHN